MTYIYASLVALIFTIGLPSMGWSGTLWFDSEVDEAWADDSNWSGAGGSPDDTQPTSTDTTYITTSDTHTDFDGIAEINGTSEDVGALYIGGWISFFDGPGGHGDSPAQTGELRLLDTSGDLTVGGSNYIRVGIRGGTGKLIQSGGDITATGTVTPTLGWGGDGSVGIHELSAGKLYTKGVNVGIQGLGLFTMTGGEFEVSCNGCSSTIGRGYLQADQIGEGEIPGVGLMVQSGGLFDSDNVYLGQESGSVGVMFIRDSADVVTSTRFFIGRSGTGSVVQTGGDVSVGWCIEIGSQGGSVGSYTIENGTLAQTGGGSSLTRCNDANGAEGVYNGVHGVGTLTVLGDDATINFVRYQQTAESTLVFMIDENTMGNAVSTVQVSKTANFEVGAKIRVGVPLTTGSITIIPPASVDLLTATLGITGITDASDLVLVGPDADDWTLSIVNGAGSEQTLVATGS